MCNMNAGLRLRGPAPSSLGVYRLHLHHFIHQLRPRSRLQRDCLAYDHRNHVFVHDMHRCFNLASFLRQAASQRALLARQMGSIGQPRGFGVYSTAHGTRAVSAVCLCLPCHTTRSGDTC